MTICIIENTQPYNKGLKYGVSSKMEKYRTEARPHAAECLLLYEPSLGFCCGLGI